MKWLIIILAILALLILVILIIGKLLPSKHTVFQEQEFKTSRAILWKSIRNFKDYPQWRTKLKKLTVIDETQWTEVDNRGDSITLGIIEADVENRLAVKIMDETLPFGGTWVYELNGTDNSVTLKITENGEVYNPIYRFIGYFFMDQSATIKQYLNDLTSHINS